MTESKRPYKTELDIQMETLLVLAAGGGIRRARLRDGLGVAYTEKEDAGLLTISRLMTRSAPGDDEVDRILASFKAVAFASGRPVLLFKKIIREVVVVQGGVRYHVVRLSVYFGEQGRLFDEFGN